MIYHMIYIIYPEDILTESTSLKLDEDAHSADFEIVELILNFFLNQISFSPEILKILITYLLTNIQRKQHLAFTLLNWEELAPHLLKVLDSMPEALNICSYLVKRAPTRVCSFDYLWRFLRYSNLAPDQSFESQIIKF